jgi:hypothetical protein
MFTFGIVAQQPVSQQIQRPMSFGTTRNLTFCIYKYGVVQLMFTFRRISEQELVLTWRNAYLLDIHKVTKVGHSTILPPCELSSQNELNSTNDTFLALNKLHSLQNHLSHFQPSHLSLYWILEGIAMQTMLQ